MTYSFFGRSKVPSGHGSATSATLPLLPSHPPKDGAWLASLNLGRKKGSHGSVTIRYRAPGDSGVLLSSQSPPDISVHRKGARGNSARSSRKHPSTDIASPSSSPRSGFSSLHFTLRRDGKPFMDVLSQSTNRPAGQSSFVDTVPSVPFEGTSGALLGSPPATQLRSHSPIPSRSPTQASVPKRSLAKDLENLSVAHSNGLLDNEEYRILRQNAFEHANNREISVHFKEDPIPLDNRLQAAFGSEEMERTGSLLRLPRLQTNAQGFRCRLSCSYLLSSSAATGSRW